MRPVWAARFRADHGQSESYAFGSVLRNALVSSNPQMNKHSVSGWSATGKSTSG